jgi:hypothetical protein
MVRSNQQESGRADDDDQLENAAGSLVTDLLAPGKLGYSRQARHYFHNAATLARLQFSILSPLTAELDAISVAVQTLPRLKSSARPVMYGHALSVHSFESGEPLCAGGGNWSFQKRRRATSVHIEGLLSVTLM